MAGKVLNISLSPFSSFKVSSNSNYRKVATAAVHVFVCASQACNIASFSLACTPPNMESFAFDLPQTKNACSSPFACGCQQWGTVASATSIDTTRHFHPFVFILVPWRLDWSYYFRTLVAASMKAAERHDSWNENKVSYFSSSPLLICF